MNEYKILELVELLAIFDIPLPEDSPWKNWTDIPDDADPAMVQARDAMVSLEEMKRHIALSGSLLNSALAELVTSLLSLEDSTRTSDAVESFDEVQRYFISGIATHAFLCGLSVASIPGMKAVEYIGKLKAKHAKARENRELIDDFIREQRAIKKHNGNPTSDEDIANQLDDKATEDERFRSESKSGKWTRHSVNARRKRAKPPIE